MSANPQTALALEKQAQAISRTACNQLLEQHEKIRARFGETAQQLWTDHLNQRVLELSAALAVGDKSIFTSRLAWSKTAMQSRELTQDDLESSLNSLAYGIRSELDSANCEAALEFIDLAVKVVRGKQPSKLETTLDPRFPNDRLALHYVQSVAAGNIKPGMQMIIDATTQGLSVQDAYLNVLLPAQREVGRLWHLNELSISEEHVVSYTTQRLMAILSTQAQQKPDNGYTAIAGTVAGNVHDLGIRAIAYLLEFEGWRTIYLGSDVPREELPKTLETYRADVVLLSLALTSQIPALTRAITEIRKHCSQPVKIMVGGNAFSENPKLGKQIGADGHTKDAQDALALAEKLVITT